MGAARRLAWTTGAWGGVGMLSGLQVHLASGLGAAPVDLFLALRLQVLAAVPWIPATYAAVAMARAWPITRRSLLPRLLGHVAAGVVAVIVLNLLIAALQGLVRPSGEVLREALEGAVRLGHLALLVWAVLVAAGHVLATRRRADPVPPREEPLLLRDHRGTVVLSPTSIRLIEAEGDYVRVHDVDGGQHVVSARMGDLEQRLAAHGFARVHRSFIVDLARVRRHFARSHGDHVLELDDGERIPLPRGRREAVLARLPEVRR